MSEQERPTQVREAAILQELQELMKEKDHQAISSKLNNLWLKFVSADTEGSPRSILHLRKDKDSKMAESFGPKDLENRSELLKDQTRSEFYQTLDQVAQELGVLEEIQNLVGQQQVELQNGKNLEDHQARLDKVRLELLEPLTRVYARLRVLGYTDKDIVS